MRATDIQIGIEMIDRRRTLAAAGEMIAEHGRIGVVVAGPNGEPQGVISALDLFRLALPDYLLDDSSLAATLDEQSLTEMIAPLRNKTIDEAITDDAVRLKPLPEVDPQATVLEIAAVLVGSGSMIAAVTGSTGDGARFVTLPVVLDAVLELAGTDRNGGNG